MEIESNINAVSRILVECLSYLNREKRFTLGFCEKASCLLNRVYANHGRYFHNIGHAHNVSMARRGSPTARLAGLYHDIVYIQLDKENRELIHEFASPFELSIADELIIGRSKDPWVEAVATIFNIAIDSSLKPDEGLNEFLSAWVAVKTFREFLKPKDLLAIVCDIFATIPLWSFSEKTQNRWSTLEPRIFEAAKILGITISQEDVQKVIDEAAEVANQDVINFASENLNVFLANTWSLLSEFNPSLRNKYFSTHTYRNALVRMELFLAQFDPQKVFRSGSTHPGTKDIEKLEEATRRNIRLSTTYLRLRVLEAAMISAFADLTGGDGPLEMFVGPKPDRRNMEGITIEQFLHFLDDTEPQDPDGAALAGLFKKGKFRSPFDGRNSVIASYLHKKMSASQVDAVFLAAVEYSKGDISPSAFLSKFDRSHLVDVVDGVRAIAFTRQEELSRLMARLDLALSADLTV